MQQSQITLQTRHVQSNLLQSCIKVVSKSASDFGARKAAVGISISVCTFAERNVEDVLEFVRVDLHVRSGDFGERVTDCLLGTRIELRISFLLNGRRCFLNVRLVIHFPVFKKQNYKSDLNKSTR